LAFTPDGTTAYVVNQRDGTVSVIDVATGTVTGTPIDVGANPVAVAFTPDGTTAYVSNSGDDTVSVIAVDRLPALAAPSSFPQAEVGTPLTFTAPLSLGSPAATFAVTGGALPDGLSLDETTGVVSGTPTTAEDFSFTITATNSVGDVSQTYTGTIIAATELAATGLESAPILGAAAALTLAGGMLLIARRRTT